MPILIGDIGGTSSRWALLADDGSEGAVRTLPGFNPTLGDEAPLRDALRGAAPVAETKGLAVYAYGAGCGSGKRKEDLRTLLAEAWPGAEITVETDLMGAALGLYGTEAAGLVLILGTGMNAGYWNGTHLHTPMPSLGFALGDEGSGADIGKLLLRDALYGIIPAKLLAGLFPEGVHLQEVLEGTYRSPSPQAYLASFAKRLDGSLENTYVHDLVASRFFALVGVLARSFSARELQQVRASGSIAFGFQKVLRNVLGESRMHLTAVQRDPMPGLLHYHASQRS